MRNVHGILLLDKPPNISSNHALQKVKRLFCAKKAGHTGSLDPIATGMLPICFGEATKFSQFLLESNKSYLVTAKLGVQTKTGDSEGDIIAENPVPHLEVDEVEQILKSFLGEMDQVPPMYSAIKFQGKPLYQLARNGIEIERKPRKITIFSIELVLCQQNELVFQVHCSKGTYVRTLVEDIGSKIGCGAHVTSLRRLMISPYVNTAMYTLPALEKIVETVGIEHLYACLLPVESAVQVFPMVKLSSSAIFYLRSGQSVRASVNLKDNTLLRLTDHEGQFIGIGELLPGGRIKPHRLVVSN